MPAQCIAPIQGTHARIVRLDECGAIVTGTGSQTVFDGFVEVAVSPQYQDGTEYILRNAQGVPCVNRRGDDQFLRDEVTIQFCTIDPDAVVLTTGQDLVSDGATGTGFWIKEGAVSARWSFELWQADSQTCTGDNPRYAYWAWPHLTTGRFQDMTVNDGTLEWRILARSAAANLDWGTGPGDTAYITAVPTNAHRGFNITDEDPPDLTGCGAATLAA